MNNGMTMISTWKNFKDAWRSEYEKLVKVYRSLLTAKKGVIVDVGCGRGQLTIPLAKIAKEYSIVSVDSYPEPYTQSRNSFELALARNNQLKKRVSLVVAEAVDWLSQQQKHAFYAVVSNEFLCEIDTTELQKFLRECHRVLRPSGLCIQSYLSPLASNRRQKLLIEANVNSKWVEFPPKEWFSPPPRLVAQQMKGIGFVGVRTITLKNDLTIRAEAAKSALKSWHVKKSFWNTYDKELMSKGLEFPDWIVSIGQRASRN